MLGIIIHVSSLLPWMSQPFTQVHVSLKHPHLKALIVAHFGRNPSTSYSGEFQVLVANNKA